MRNFKIEIPLSAMERLTLSNESITDALKSGLDTLSEFKDKLLEALPDVMRGLEGTQLKEVKKIDQLTADQKQFNEHLSKNNYASLRLLKATAPEGLRSSYVTYLKALAPAVEHMKRITPDLLHPYTVFLAHLVSSKKANLSYNTNAHLYDKFKLDREECYEGIKKCFSGDHNTRTTYGSVVDNNAEWSEVIKLNKKLVDDVNGIKVSEVSHLMRQADDYLKIIYEYIENGKIEDVTPETAKALSEGALQVGYELEFFSIIYYRVLGLNNAINQTITDINRIISAE